MLVIGHRGAAGIAPENTLEALRAGMAAGADMLEFDIRLTKDRIPVLVHDFHMVRTHRQPRRVSQLTLAQLQKKSSKYNQPVALLSEVLDEFMGNIMLNIELKSREAGKVAAELIKEKYIQDASDWDNLLFSAFKGSTLSAIRKISQEANLALLHDRNPFIFIAYHRRLQLTAVGFHRLYINPFALEIARRANIFTYAYTVNRPRSALLLARQGIDGIVTDRPDRILSDIAKSKTAN